MITAAMFIDKIHKMNFTKYAGVPCSYLKPLLNYVIDSAKLDYVAATSEGEAVGINVGAYLAGQKTVTMCQNSGLGNMVNPLTSVNYPFKVPSLLIITWRGQPGMKDEPQHEQMGQITKNLLDTLQIPWTMFPKQESEVEAIVEQADTIMNTRLLPFALIMEKDAVEANPLKGSKQISLIKGEKQGGFECAIENRPSRINAIEAVLETLQGDEAIIATTGKTGRELFTLGDRPNQLYVVGGMGTASAIGFGIAHSLPKQKVVILDGDGAALMKMGNFATIGFYQPDNLLHIILDNQVYDSTGGQSTSSACIDFTTIAFGANYRCVHAADSLAGIKNSMNYLLNRPGPSLLHIKIIAGSVKNLGRPTVKPHEVKERFMDFLKNNN